MSIALGNESIKNDMQFSDLQTKIKLVSKWISELLYSKKLTDPFAVARGSSDIEKQGCPERRRKQQPASLSTRKVRPEARRAVRANRVEGDREDAAAGSD